MKNIRRILNEMQQYDLLVIHNTLWFGGDGVQNNRQIVDMFAMFCIHP